MNYPDDWKEADKEHRREHLSLVRCSNCGQRVVEDEAFYGDDEDALCEHCFVTLHKD